MRTQLYLALLLLSCHLHCLQSVRPNRIWKRQEKLDGYGFNLIGALFSGGSIVPWESGFSDKNSDTFKEIEDTLCKYLKVFTGINGLTMKVCRMAQLSEAKTSIGSYTNVYVQLLTDLLAPDKNQLSDRDQARSDLMEVLKWFANIGMAKYYIGVKQEPGFGENDVFGYGTSDSNLIIAWPLKSSGCQEKYQVEWRLKSEEQETKKSGEICQNSYGPIDIDPTKKYEYRVLRKDPSASEFSNPSAWTDKRTTNEAVPILVSGPVRTIGNQHYPYIPELSDLTTSTAGTVGSNLCDSLQMTSLDQGVVPIVCRTLHLNKDKSGNTLGNVQMDVIKKDNPDVKKTIKDAISVIATSSPDDPNRLNIFFGEDTLVDEFYGNGPKLGYTSETTQNLTWSGYPTDCSYTYEINYRSSTYGPISTQPALCKNTVKVTNLQENTPYQYQLVFKNKNGTNQVTLPWSELKSTKIKSNCPLGCILAASIGTVVGVSAIAALGMFFLYKRNKKKMNMATKMMLSDISKHFSSSTLRDSFNENQTGKYNDLRLPQRSPTPKMTKKIKDLIHRVS